MADKKFKVGQTVSYDGDKYTVWSSKKDKVQFVLQGYSNPKYNLPLDKVVPLEELTEIINNKKLKTLSD